MRIFKMEVDLTLDEWITLLETILEVENSLYSDAWQSFLEQLLLNRELRDYLLDKESNNQITKFERELLEVINTWLENDPNRDNHEFTTVQIEDEVKYF